MTSTSTDLRFGVNSNAAVKVPCRVATTANITLSGEQTIDGVAVVTDDRVLVKDQTSSINNGIYIADTGTWSRAPDFDGSYDVVFGTFVYTTSGSVGSGYWYITTSNPITIGTTAIAFGRASTELATVSAFMQTVLDDTTAAIARTTLGAAGLTGNETLAGNKTFSGNTTLSGTNVLGGTTTMSGAQLRMAKGADIASATTVDLTAATGNTVHITGTTTTTGVTLSSGTWVLCIADGAWPLTYHGTTMKLNTGGASYTCAAGDRVLLFYDGTTTFGNITRQNGLPTIGRVMQVVNSTDSAVATGTTIIPRDDTIPQNTEGDQYLSLAITPTNSSNKLLIEINVFLANSAGGGTSQVVLFQDSTANALAVTGQGFDSAGKPVTIAMSHYMTAGTTSATTFKVRCGCDQAGTTTFNGTAGGRLYGGVSSSNITITEITV